MKRKTYPSPPKARVIKLTPFGKIVAGPVAALDTFRVMKRAIEMRDDEAMVLAAQAKRARKNMKRQQQGAKK